MNFCIYPSRYGGADEGEEEVESEERESRRRLGPGHEVEEAEVGEERDGEQLRRHALGVHGGRPRVHGEQPAPHHHPARRRRSPLHPASAAEAIASPGSTGGERPRPRARRRAAGGRQHLGVANFSTRFPLHLSPPIPSSLSISLPGLCRDGGRIGRRAKVLKIISLQTVRKLT